jgi:hypothetical protein
MCMICDSKEETKYINIYPFGSEGLQVCHKCEMEIVEFVRGLRSQNFQKLMQDHKKKIITGDVK